MTQNAIIYKSHQKTVFLRDGKPYDGDAEVTVNLLPNADETELAMHRARHIAREYYRKLLARPYENIVVLTGAGTSRSSGGKLMTELWDEEFHPVNRISDAAFFNKINFRTSEERVAGNIEELLSQAQKAAAVLPLSESTQVAARIRSIKEAIVQKCTLNLSRTSPHLAFLHKITSRKLKYSRIKVFTLNYDTLFEQAAAEGKFVVINGFSFSHPSCFNGAYFDYDIVNRRDGRVSPDESYLTKVFHLYKPHGSINWEKSSNDEIVARDITIACNDPYIIYPNSDKYEYAYDQPFFEMMSRFQQAVRLPNTLLICVGFGFGDKHFKNVIIESVKSNPGLILLVVLPQFMENTFVRDIAELSEHQNNIVLVNEDFQGLADNYPFSGEYEHSDKEDNQSLRQ